RHGRIRQTVVAYVAINLVLTSGAVWLFDGVYSPVWTLYIWTIAIAGTLLSPVHALRMTWAVAGYFLLLLLLSRLGLYAPRLTFGGAREILQVSFVLIMLVSTVGFLTFVNMRGLEAALRRLREEIVERKRMEARIGLLNERLEERVEERTRQLLEAQQELVLKERLAVLGQVAASVGHELRNPLGVMNNAVYYLEAALPQVDATTAEYLGIIRDEIATADRIVADLLDSVRTPRPRENDVDLRELLAQTVRQCRIPSAVTVRVEVPATLSRARVDPLQMTQVFRNLVSNSVDAMPLGGTLEIRAAEDPSSKTVSVRVKDSGGGIPPEHLSRLFQPLFTTKARGIGLGLVVVKNLTRANGGRVCFASEPGEGATFTVTLPASVSAVGPA
ncbi:MAG: hypothetical protein HY900_27835, partial [Deltaproteobacteria bacterium]|nr:hypothetical protein [Deltaproteobacteria bacterium]